MGLRPTKGHENPLDSPIVFSMTYEGFSALPYKAAQLVPRPFDLFLNASGRACPAPTPALVGARHASPPRRMLPRGQERNHAVTALGLGWGRKLVEERGIGGGLRRT